MIFGKHQRSDPQPARYGEGRFEFLDRCDSVGVERIRRELEQWIGRYPEEHRVGFAKRFRSQFDSAFFELLVHELLIRQEFEVRVHVDAGDRGRHPDFEVSIPASGESFILEATLCHDCDEDRSESGRLNPVYNAIDSIDCPFCFISICDVDLKNSTQPSSRRITDFLNENLAKIDPEILLDLAVRSGDLPRLSYADETIGIEFELIPKKREAWGRHDSRNIGILPTISRWGDCSTVLRKKLRKKASRYGQHDKPYMIAVNMVGPWGYDDDELMQSLFGTREEFVTSNKAEFRSRILRDGFWGSVEKPTHTRVSAVLIGCAVPVNVPRIDLCLYPNPWATNPLPNGFWKLPMSTISDGKLVRENQDVTTGSLLGLAADWPGDLFPNRRRTNLMNE